MRLIWLVKSEEPKSELRSYLFKGGGFGQGDRKGENHEKRAIFNLFYGIVGGVVVIQGRG